MLYFGLCVLTYNEYKSCLVNNISHFRKLTIFVSRNLYIRAFNHDDMAQGKNSWRGETAVMPSSKYIHRVELLLVLVLLFVHQIYTDGSVNSTNSTSNTKVSILVYSGPVSQPCSEDLANLGKHSLGNLVAETLPQVKYRHRK